MNLLFVWCMVVFEWEGFGLEFFRNYTRLSIYIFLDTEIDLYSFGKIRARILPTQIQTSDIQIQGSLHWSWYKLFKVTKIKNQVFWMLFTYPSSDAKWTAESSELVRSMSLDIQILNLAIWLYYKHLKTPTNQFLLGFKYSTPLN